MLAELIESVDATQTQDRQWFTAALEQVELNRLRDSTAFASFAVRTEDELQRTKQGFVQLLSYGVLFLMKVDFPLLPPLQTQQEDATEEKEEGDKVWEDTRRQLYEPELLAKRKKDDSAVEYGAEKVENLKTTLIKALKHASNIRNLKPEESAILTITGGGNGAMVTTHSAIVVSGRERVVHESPSSAVGSAACQALVIRAKKADIDSFAKGALDLEQFRQRVQMINYPLLEGEGGRGRAADFYYR